MFNGLGGGRWRIQRWVLESQLTLGLRTSVQTLAFPLVKRGLHAGLLMKEWQPTPVFLPGESRGQKSLVGCCPWGRTESDMTKATWQFMHALEKEMATHSSVLAWRIPWTEEPGGPPSIGSHRVGHD